MIVASSSTPLHPTDNFPVFSIGYEKLLRERLTGRTGAGVVLWRKRHKQFDRHFPTSPAKRARKHAERNGSVDHQ
jgi:hypothetical protein